MKIKICANKTCLQSEKPLSEFSKDKSRKDGYQTICKSCNQIYRDNHKNEYHDYYQIYQDINKEKLAKKNSIRYQKNKEIIKQKNKEYRDSHLEYYTDYNKEYRKIYDIENKEKIKKQRKERFQSDIKYKIITNLRRRLNHALKGNNKSKKTLELLDCSIEQLKQHLQFQFTEGMSWDNYGAWHIDHRIPCTLFDLSKKSEQKKCFNFKNLQPLWAIDNLRKGSKILYGYKSYN